MKIYKNYWLLVILFLNSCTDIHKNNAPTVMNMSYHDARQKILENGWKPATQMPLFNEIGSIALYFQSLEYNEVYDCTGAGKLLCTFYFQNQKGQYLKIRTEGEYYNPHFEVDTRVVYAAIVNEINQ